AWSSPTGTRAAGSGAISVRQGFVSRSTAGKESGGDGSGGEWSAWKSSLGAHVVKSFWEKSRVQRAQKEHFSSDTARSGPISRILCNVCSETPSRELSESSRKPTLPVALKLGVPRASKNAPPPPPGQPKLTEEWPHQPHRIVEPDPRCSLRQ